MGCPFNNFEKCKGKECYSFIPYMKTENENTIHATCTALHLKITIHKEEVVQVIKNLQEFEG